MTDALPHVGEEVVMGAFALAAKESNDDIVVLAWWPHKGEFVTWNAKLEDDMWVCWNGHYFSSLPLAIKNYERR